MPRGLGKRMLLWPFNVPNNSVLIGDDNNSFLYLCEGISSVELATKPIVYI